MSRTRTTRPMFSRAAATTLLAGAAALAAVPVIGVATPALAHDQLIGSAVELDPADGSADAVLLTFSNSVIEVGTEIVITAPGGADATDGDPVVDGPDVSQPLQADLAPGSYSGAWRVVSSDGHPIEGVFTLTVPESGDPTISDEAISEDDPRFADEGAETEGDHDHADAEGDHDHAQAEDAGSEESGAPVGAVIAVVVGGAAVIAGGIAAATAGNRRRARGMAADAERQRAAAGTADTTDTHAGEDREDRA